MDNAIVLDRLTKRYGHAPHLALDKVSLTIKKGEVYGLLGPNGAGKSTAIRTLLNFIQPTDGNAAINGYDVVKNSLQAHHSLGYLAGDVALYGTMTGSQFLHYMGALQGRPTPARAALIQQLHVTTNQPIKSLSKGNRQKVGLVQAFMHEPEVLILDEPTSGLDPLMQEAFFTLVAETKQRGATILVSSHNLTEVQRMCDRVGFIRQGKLIHEQTVSELQTGPLGKQTFTIVFASPPPRGLIKPLGATAKVLQAGGKTMDVAIQGSLTPLLALLAKHEIVTIQKHESNLEEEFLSLYHEAEDER